jgi:hypothetical protein
VYGVNAGNNIQIDANYLTGDFMYNNGTQTYGSFTVVPFERLSVEPANATPPNTSSFGLGRYNDGTTTTSNVVTTGGTVPAASTSTFDQTKYAQLDQAQSPWTGFVPTGAVITASSVTVSYNAATASGANMCIEIAVYVSGTLTLAAASTPTCSTGNGVNTQFTLNTTAYINTPAKASNVFLRVIPNNNGATMAKLAIDYAKLSVTYSLD